MGGLFDEAARPRLSVVDFSPNGQFRVEANQNGAIIIGDASDQMLKTGPVRVHPASGIIDVWVHGLPGRFVETIHNPSFEIPPAVLAELIENEGAVRGSPIRLLSCNSGEICADGRIAAQLFADEWKGMIRAPNGLLRVPGPNQLRVDLVDWIPDVVNPGQMVIDNIRPGNGSFVLFAPTP